MRLVVTPHAANATVVQEDYALIELVAQGQRWFEQWLRRESLVTRDRVIGG